MIPDSAIEAAHKAWREQAKQDGSIFEYNLRAAIEAAAPHMLAEAWQVGFSTGRDFEDFYFKSAEPPRPLPEQPANPYSTAK